MKEKTDLTDDDEYPARHRDSGKLLGLLSDFEYRNNHAVPISPCPQRKPIHGRITATINHVIMICRRCRYANDARHRILKDDWFDKKHKNEIKNEIFSTTDNRNKAFEKRNNYIERCCRELTQIRETSMISTSTRIMLGTGVAGLLMLEKK